MGSGWQGSTRSKRLPADWPKRRALVLKRDGYRCRWIENGERCTTRATDVDHIHGDDDHRLASLQSLCGPHHQAKTQAEAQRARWALRRQRPSEPHPGIR